MGYASAYLLKVWHDFCNKLNKQTYIMYKKIGSLILISNTNGFDWDVYDEDKEYQGKFCGDVNTATEQDIWAGL